MSAMTPASPGACTDLIDFIWCPKVVWYGYQAASVAELHAQSQRYCAQLQEYNANLQKDMQAAAVQLQTSTHQLQRLQVSHIMRHTVR